MNKTYSVLIIDMSRYQDTESERIVEGFPTFEIAREFARRWVRDSLEELRTPGQTREELRRAWSIFGEDAVVLCENRYAGSHELDFFIDNPASAEDRDWKLIKKEAGIE
ncbi:MAG: hypothetical protein L0229_23030 [Blastocatellia bacterium]|nr:hypothetical protein [Blastocatellia bacterium]